MKISAAVFAKKKKKTIDSVIQAKWCPTLVTHRIVA
jgi:hypothetical protein